MYDEPAPVTRSGQGRVIAGVAAGVVALALLGFAVGYLAFHGGTPAVSATPTAGPPSTQVGSIGPGGLADYHGQNFIAVRADLRDRHLGVRLLFGSGPEDPTVLRTDPPAGATVRAGVTVKVYVTGSPPLLTLPAVVGQPCNVAGKALADAGVFPAYPTGRLGVVVSTEPDTAATTVHWNDSVQLRCARPGTSPSPVPQTSSGSPDPDASPPPEPSTSSSEPAVPQP
jgi:beta-lactam-binding protein with PASTA domain